MGNYRFTGKEFKIGHLLWKGYTYDKISNAVRCSNRDISRIKKKLLESGVYLSRVKKGAVRVGQSARNFRTTQGKPLQVPGEVVDILHKAIRTRLISNRESKSLLSWCLKGRVIDDQ